MTIDETHSLFASEAPAELPRPMGEEYLNKVVRDWEPLRPTPVFATYWYFAAARQELFYRRLCGEASPWTADLIMRSYRFTNVYRASDRVSQYLIREVLNPEAGAPAYGIRDTLFRILLFKLFNRVETWQMLEKSLKELSWRNYSFDDYDAVLTAALERGDRIFSAAYIMPSGRSSYGSQRKHRNCLRLLEEIITGGGAEKVCGCQSLKELFLLLRSYPLMGDFIAYQFAIDINYSYLTDFEESTFVVAGPGAHDGIAKCFSNAKASNPSAIISMMAERQADEFKRVGLNFRSLWGRPLQLIDCQNLFCEVGKYARMAHPEVPGVSGRTRIKQTFRPGTTRPLPLPFYPPKWEINSRVKMSLARFSATLQAESRINPILP